MIFTQIFKTDLDPPHQELSNGSFGIVVALLVHLQINFLSAHIGCPIQLYTPFSF